MSKFNFKTYNLYKKTKQETKQLREAGSTWYGRALSHMFKNTAIGKAANAFTTANQDTAKLKTIQEFTKTAYTGLQKLINDKNEFLRKATNEEQIANFNKICNDWIVKFIEEANLHLRSLNTLYSSRVAEIQGISVRDLIQQISHMITTAHRHLSNPSKQHLPSVRPLQHSVGRIRRRR